jgi:putative ABC transport system permease protein
MTHPMIVELKEGVSVQQFEAKMNKWVKGYFFEPFFAESGKNNKDIDEGKMNWMLRPLADCHYNISSPWGHYTNAKNIYQLSCLVIIILVIASLNYILLAVSSGASRSLEIGVRKVMGASRRSVILQFWTETQMVVVMAMLVGLVLAQILLPYFNKLIDSNLSLKDFYLPQTALALICLAVALGLLAGYYPALFISRIKPVSILKSFQTFRVNPRFSKLLVVIQYSVCIILMMAAFVITRQMRYISNKDLGFDKEQVVLVENQTFDREKTKTIREHLAVFAQSEPSIIQYASMTGGLDGAGNRNGFKLNGEQQWLRQLDVDYNYFKLLGINFVQGRPFSPSILSDTSRTQRPCVVNETLFKLLGSTAKLGEYNEAIRSTIIGVVKDYHIETLSKKIEPEQHMLIRGYIRYFMFKVKPGDTQQSIAKIQQAWKESSGGIPFEYTFLDQTIARMYEAEIRWQNIIQASCFFAIIIACMGLFGLSAINTTNRVKEIGIRKVLGASVREVVSSLSFRFIIMVLIAFVIAIPASWWIMNKWLEDFEYRITITWWMYVLVGIAAMMIALLTVGYQAVKAAMANPVDSLRAE